MTFWIVLVGIILLLVSWMVRVSVYHIDDSDTMQIIMTVVDLFSFLGVAILAIGLFHGGLKNEFLADRIKMACLVAGGLIIGFVASGIGSLAFLSWL